MKVEAGSGRFKCDMRDRCSKLSYTAEDESDGLKLAFLYSLEVSNDWPLEMQDRFHTFVDEVHAREKESS